MLQVLAGYDTADPGCADVPVPDYSEALGRPVAGLTAISVPCGFDREGLPIGLQIAGRPFDEPTVLRVAHAYEQTHDWKDQRPAL